MNIYNLSPQAFHDALVPAGELDMKEFVGGLLQLWLMDVAWREFFQK